MVFHRLWTATVVTVVIFITEADVTTVDVVSKPIAVNYSALESARCAMQNHDHCADAFSAKPSEFDMMQLCCQIAQAFGD